MKAFLISLLVLAVAGFGIWYYARAGTEEGSVYRFVEVEMGDLEAVVSSTGSLEAVTTVQVGTQVSGIIDKIYVDFNDPVRQGQLVAQIDTTLLVSAIRDAEANLQRLQAQQAHTQRELDRIQQLYEKQFLTAVEYNTAVYNAETALAQLESAKISLERARLNRTYATIRAPISGIVIERNVDVGQTVAASFSAPQLFLIANDLSQMQILAVVDESDIGLIKEGQPVRFNVQAYSEDTFNGTVRQVRLQSVNQENVVNYTVVVDVPNKDGRLLPGMTATVEFLIERAERVMKVPNAALRFQPTQEMMEAVQAQRQTEMESLPDSVRQQMAERRGQGGGEGFVPGAGFGNGGAFGAGRGRGNASMLWYIDAAGQLAMARVRTGITDGQMTEIEGPAIEPGLQVIAGITQGEASSSTSNPFQSQQETRRGPPGTF